MEFNTSPFPDSMKRCPICHADTQTRVIHLDVNLMSDRPRQVERWVKVTAWQCMARSSHHGEWREPTDEGPYRRESVVADDPCTLPPEGWYCTRGAGHDGPCAAHPMPSPPGWEASLYDFAKRYVEAVEWNEEHPEDVHSEAGVEMALDYLVAGVKKRIEEGS